MEIILKNIVTHVTQRIKNPPSFPHVFGGNLFVDVRRGEHDEDTPLLAAGSFIAVPRTKKLLAIQTKVF